MTAYFRRNTGHKYGAKKTSLDGYSFGSKLEASVYGILKLREAAGEIESIQVQDHVYLTAARIAYVADFAFTVKATGARRWAEAKGVETPVWRLKRKLWKHFGPGYLEIWKGSHVRPVLVETIEVIE
jgi:hypothetical protein